MTESAATNGLTTEDRLVALGANHERIPLVVIELHTVRPIRITYFENLERLLFVFGLWIELKQTTAERSGCIEIFQFHCT